ncbi:MAG: valine--tRNA ligase [Eubacteriales bacterium]|nr:valine--tRNA ligase [Eubacteriales bacterium]MDD4512400.1 valine--tRNA ligase [Eubacteriales bacterium]
MDAKTFEMEKNYDPKLIEDRLYKEWEESGAFKPVKKEGAKSFTVVMPPPNITGQLHMGHAMDMTMQDTLVRYHRLKGDETLWLPGTDHASIATEVRVADTLAKQGITKQQLGREGFLEKVWQWKEEYGGRIEQQTRKMGSSCDWSRKRFTMDEGCSKAVREVFVRLYEKGLIYRGNRIINWCPECRTALSDAEVEFEEQKSHLWHVRYMSADGKTSVVVATTRPETMLGDTGVAVNPSDSRYTALIGKNVILPIMNREIPVVADEYVDMEFGTGAVKMTPAHDPNDFEVAKRHDLKIIRVMNDDGTMNAEAGKYEGMTALQCREKIVEELDSLGLLVKVEDYSHNVGTCYRCHHTVEPLTSVQWFVKMEPLAKPAIDVVKRGETKFIPERFTKTYYNWMENIRDWCISRQLWWGHRIPAWYCDDCGETIVSRETPEKCPKCGCAHLHQDEDVLDTWFSSALWPFSTLGWPEETEDLKTFFPTSVLVTGYDIIFFWVARMIFSSVEQMGKTPFHTVLMHGLVRDSKGRKMSKSLGNGLDPLEIIDQYGADALRFSLIMGVAPGNDMRYSTEKVEAARNFANKIWNASRFVLMNMDKPESLDESELTLPDKWILSRYNKAVRDVTVHMDDCDLGLAAQSIYDFAWGEFCDWYIELCKSRLLGENEREKRTVKAVLSHVLIGVLKLLHPFMPYVTDSVYRYIPGTEGTIMTKDWPIADSAFDFEKEESEIQGVMDIIRAIRNLRAEMNVQAGRRTHLMLLPSDGWMDALKDAGQYFTRLAMVSETIIIASRAEVTEKVVSHVCPAAELFIPLGDLVDIGKEIQRLEKEMQSIRQEIARANGKLANEGFLSKAPAALIEQEKAKLATNEQMLISLSGRIEELKG